MTSRSCITSGSGNIQVAPQSGKIVPGSADELLTQGVTAVSVTRIQRERERKSSVISEKWIIKNMALTLINISGEGGKEKAN